MRELTDHQVNPANDKLRVYATDEQGSGRAHHVYSIHGLPSGHQVIAFQNGPIGDVGVNGLTQEILLSIVADRLRCFQAGPYATKANACALTHIEEAQHWLQQRTLERMRRGVEGTHAV